MGMQHNFIETLEATSIYKQGNGSSLNIKSFFRNQNDIKELREGINSQGLDQQWQVHFFIQKITYEIFQVYRNIVTHGLCKSMIGFTAQLSC